MDSYQAIYDAVRSRISGGNLGEVVERAAREAFDMGHARAILQEQIGSVGYEMQRPAAIFRPALSIDGNMWCALYGENLQDGCAGFGPTPADAMADFDKNWREQRISARLEDEDPTPWCSGCGAKRKADCHCGPIAEND